MADCQYSGYCLARTGCQAQAISDRHLPADNLMHQVYCFIAE